MASYGSTLLEKQDLLRRKEEEFPLLPKLSITQWLNIDLVSAASEEDAAGKEQEDESDSSSTSSDDSDEELLAPEVDETPLPPPVIQASKGALPPPLPLFSFSTSTSMQPPKNGTGVAMMYPGPQHIDWVPPQPEPFYRAPSNLLEQVLARHAERLAHPSAVLNRIVFDSVEPNPSHAQTCIDPPAPGKLNPYYIVEGSNDRTLVFESRFESGNLRRAIQVYESEYDLILNPDFNTRGHTQWYYFSCSNTRTDMTYRFNIINLVKPDSLYNQGMRPLMYSERLAKEKGIGWHRFGEDICYYQNHIKRRNGFYYSLTFSCNMLYDNDTVYLAYCYPYSFTDLQNHLRELEQDPKRKTRFRRRTLCQTLAGNNVDLLTITSFACDPEALKARKGVVISSRVHPGESNASWMMKGVIDFLTGPSLDAKILRDNFVFKIVPMLNPDGVICGNYRCSLAGKDLNRQWKNPDKAVQPSIWHMKQMLKRFSEDRDILIFCDLHGHSRKKNIFMYGCDNKENVSLRLKERIFPRMLWKTAQCFSFSDCNFRVQRAKESTARVVVWREMRVMNSFTMEASFAGANFGRLMNQHFTTANLEEMGHFFCVAMLDYCDPDQTRAAAVFRELEMLFPVSSYESDDEESQGSDDNPSEDNDPRLSLAMLKRKARKKKTKKRRKGEKRGRSRSKLKDGDKAGGTAGSGERSSMEKNGGGWGGGMRLGQGGNPGKARQPPPPPPRARSVSLTTSRSKTPSRPASVADAGRVGKATRSRESSGFQSAPESSSKSEESPKLVPRFPMPYAKFAGRLSEQSSALATPRSASTSQLILSRESSLDQPPLTSRMTRVAMPVSHVSLSSQSTPVAPLPAVSVLRTGTELAVPEAPSGLPPRHRTAQMDAPVPLRSRQQSVRRAVLR